LVERGKSKEENTEKARAKLGVKRKEQKKARSKLIGALGKNCDKKKSTMKKRRRGVE